jgi:hypothetical protein
MFATRARRRQIASNSRGDGFWDRRGLTLAARAATAPGSLAAVV